MNKKIMDVYLRKAEKSDTDELVSAFLRSADFLSPLISSPDDIEKYINQKYLYLVCLPEEKTVVGVFNITEVVRGSFQSAYLGYCAFVPYQGKGYMKAGLKLLIKVAFDKMNLHRLEANIQSSNIVSISLVEKTGFTKEGYSPKYLRIEGEWKGHERWAIINENWLEDSEE
jgi:[ribosomal protein S5]-alanine N-acetyltransferase